MSSAHEPAAVAGSGHTAIVTGANHGIGAATAAALAERGDAVLCAYWLVHDAADPGIPQAYRDRRAGGADAVVAEIEATGGRALAAEADLSDPEAGWPTRSKPRVLTGSAARCGR